MRLLNLLIKKNRWDSAMNVSDAFKSLKNRDHSASLEALGPWLDQQSKKPTPMKNFYKIAASLITTALILVACTVPVQYEEEIGYMIQGLVTESPMEGKGKIATLSAIQIGEIQFIPVIHEQLHSDGSTSNTQELTEVVLLLPEANIEVAKNKATALESVLAFTQINIHPIEEKVERTFFESALHKTFDVKIDPELSDADIEARLNDFMHKNSSITDQVDIKLDANGNRYAIFNLNVQDNADGTTSYEVKRDIEQLYQDLSPENNEVILEEDAQQIKKLEEQKNNQQ